MIAAFRQRSQASAKPALGLYDAVIALWLMAALFFPVNYVGRTQDNRVMTYDATGNLLTVSEPDASKAGKADVAYSYDALKRQLTETSGGLTHQYRYDLAGNRISVLYGGLSVPLISAYDAQNRLSTLTQGPLVTTYTYDLDGNILTKTLPNGDATTSTFDAANRTMTLVSTRGSGGLPLSSYTYAYDPAANVKQVTEAYADPAMNRVVTNTYDAINRLTQEAVTGSGAGTTLYSYDDAHNRETMTKGGVLTSYSYNSRNQLTSFTEGSSRTVSYTYDNNGNRLTRTEGINTDTFTWDNENRLIALAKTSLGGSGTYGWGYDYRTRRVELAYNTTVTKAVFSGGTEVREFENGLPSVDYVRGSDWGGGVGGILYTERAGLPSFTHYNRRGDVTAKTDATGNITYQATYEAFGKRVTETGATLDRQKSNTKDEDVPGYANEGFRFRDLETGAFLSKDPAGFVDGPNLYAYVVQNPWTKFDPKGLRGQNNNEKKALQAMRDVERDVRKAAQIYAGLAADNRLVGNTAQADAIEKTAKKETERADNLAKSIGKIEKMIADSPSEDKDPRRLKVLNSAFARWVDPKLQASYSYGEKGGSRTESTFADQNKCNIFLFDCLVQSGFVPQSLLHPGTKNPALAGKWNDPSFSPAGLGVKDVQSFDVVTGKWSSTTGALPDLQPGDVATYGQAGAAASSAHATISLGEGWLINASDSPAYNQSGGVNIKPDAIAGEIYGQRTVRTP